MVIKKANIINIRRGLKQTRLYKNKHLTPKNFVSSIELLIPDDAYGPMEANSKIDIPQFVVSEGQGSEPLASEIVDILAIQIDTTSGTATTYGDIVGTPDGSLTIFYVKESKYKKGSLRLWQNGQLQTKGTDYTESAPVQAQFTLTTAPLNGEILSVAYNTNDTDDGLINISSDATADVIQIVGAIDGANTDFTIPPYISGKLWIELNGLFQTQGTAEDWKELDNTAGTIRFITAPASGEALGGAFVPLTGGYINENTDGNLTYTFDGSNMTGTTSWAYKSGSLQLRWNGQNLEPGTDYVETDQANCKWDVTTAKAGGVISAHYRIWGGGIGSPRMTPVLTKTADYIATAYDKRILGDATGGAITVTLPTATAGLEYTIIKLDASGNAVTVATTGAANINNAATHTLGTRYATITVVCDGTDWWIIAEY